MKNKLTDLNDYLFEALEKIQTAETKEELKDAIQEGKAVASIGKVIVGNNNLQFNAFKYVKNNGLSKERDSIPEYLEVEHKRIPEKMNGAKV